MARPDLSSCFEHTHLPHGGDGKRVRGIIARCGQLNCTTAIPLPVNTMAHGGSQTEEVEWRFIANKLEAKGWSIGRRRQDHRCPRCLKNAKLEATEAYTFETKSRKPHAPGNMQLVKEAFMTSATPTTVLPKSQLTAQQEPRTMTRDDRRIIFEKLNEVYVNDKVGYSDGWSDAKVSADLGVPLAWVRTIRDENFGEEITSDNIRNKVKEAVELVASVNKLRPAIEDARKLLGLADKIEKEIAAISKAMGVTK